MAMLPAAPVAPTDNRRSPFDEGRRHTGWFEMLAPSPRPSYPPGKRPLRNTFVLTLMIGGIMFIGAATLYGMTVGLLALEPVVKSWAALGSVH